MAGAPLVTAVILSAVAAACRSDGIIRVVDGQKWSR
jgi:hypothetical protein